MTKTTKMAMIKEKTLTISCREGQYDYDDNGDDMLDYEDDAILDDSDDDDDDGARWSTTTCQQCRSGGTKANLDEPSWS